MKNSKQIARFSKTLYIRDACIDQNEVDDDEENTQNCTQ